MSSTIYNLLAGSVR